MELKDLPENLRRQAEAKLKEQNIPQKQKKRNKYGNSVTEIAVEGSKIRFDSKKEAERYNYLKTQEKLGRIRNLTLQHHFNLVGTHMNSDGEKIRGMDYVADFTYMDGNTLVIEDVKSEATRKDKVYQLKKKLMADKGFTITEV